jgi:hypothetical protein
MKTVRQTQAAVWAIVPFLLWMLIGGAFAPRSGRAIASSLTTHLSCVCRMCKGGPKTCCCTPANADRLCASCDVADDDDIVRAVAPSLLPSAIDILPLPSVCPLTVTISHQTEIIASRLPVPLLTPPKHLS